MNGNRLDEASKSASHGQGGPAGDVLVLIGEVERHLDRIRQAQEAGSARAAAAEERFRSLELRETQVAERAEAVESARTLMIERERVMASERESMMTMRDELTTRETVLRERAIALKGEAERIERESAAARTVAAEAESRCRELSAERDALAGERDAARSAAERFRLDAASLHERSGQLESRLAELESRGRALDAALVAKDAELASSRHALEIAVGKLTTLAAAVATYAPQVERVAAACPPGSVGPVIELEPLKSRIAELESLLHAVQHERSNLESEITTLRQRISGLESDLARAVATPVAVATTEPSDSTVQREFALRLEDKSRRIAELAGFLRTRKHRLDRVRLLLKSRTDRPAVAVSTVSPVGTSAARIAEPALLGDAGGCRPRPNVSPRPSRRWCSDMPTPAPRWSPRGPSFRW